VPNNKTYSIELQNLIDANKSKQSISLNQALAGLQQSSFGILLIFFALPLALPIPALGIATVMALPMIFIAWQMIQGKNNASLPKFLGNKQITIASLSKVKDKSQKYLNWLEKFIKPRLQFLTNKRAEQCLGLFLIILACVVATPIPFSNTVPSMGIVLISLGLLENDGLFILGGIFVGFIGILLTILAVIFGIEVVKQAIYAIF